MSSHLVNSIDKELTAIGQNGLVTLFMSGGIDSQFLAYRLIQLGIPFHTVFFKFENDINSADFQSVMTFQERFGLSQCEVVPLSLSDFLKIKLDCYVHQYRICHPFTALACEFTNFGGNNLLFGCGIPNLYRHGQAIYRVSKTDQSEVDRYAQMQHKRCCYNFYSLPSIWRQLQQEQKFISWVRQLSYCIPRYEDFKSNIYQTMFKHHQVKKLPSFGHYRDIWYQTYRHMNSPESATRVCERVL